MQIRPLKNELILNVEDGFTLIELILIIVIIAAVSAVATVQFGNLLTDANDATINGTFTAMKAQLGTTVGECRSYPTVANGNGTCSAATSDFSGSFKDTVTDRVAGQLTGSVALSGYNAAAGTVRICSGGASGRSAVATYAVSGNAGTLTLGAKAAGMSPCATP